MEEQEQYRQDYEAPDPAGSDDDDEEEEEPDQADQLPDQDQSYVRPIDGSVLTGKSYNKLINFFIKSSYINLV